MKLTIGELEQALARCTLPRSTPIEVTGEMFFQFPATKCEGCEESVPRGSGHGKIVGGEVSYLETLGARAILHVTE